jgi:excisionase family DNA binding protein
VECIFYTVDQAAELIGASRASIYRWSKSGLFPEIIAFGSKRSGIRRTDLDEWARTRSARTKTPA